MHVEAELTCGYGTHNPVVVPTILPLSTELILISFMYAVHSPTLVLLIRIGYPDDKRFTTYITTISSVTCTCAGDQSSMALHTHGVVGGARARGWRRRRAKLPIWLGITRAISPMSICAASNGGLRDHHPRAEESVDRCTATTSHRPCAAPSIDRSPHAREIVRRLVERSTREAGRPFRRRLRRTGPKKTPPKIKKIWQPSSADQLHKRTRPPRAEACASIRHRAGALHSLSPSSTDCGALCPMAASVPEAPCYLLRPCLLTNHQRSFASSRELSASRTILHTPLPRPKKKLFFQYIQWLDLVINHHTPDMHTTIYHFYPLF